LLVVVVEGQYGAAAGVLVDTAALLRENLLGAVRLPNHH
jgi:hypothetical protein